MRPTWNVRRVRRRLRSRMLAAFCEPFIVVGRFRRSAGGRDIELQPAAVADFRARADDMDASANRRHAAAAQRAHALRISTQPASAIARRPRPSRTVAGGTRRRWPPSRTADAIARRTPTDATLAGLDRAIRLEPKNADHFLAARVALSQVARAGSRRFAISIRRSRSIREMAPALRAIVRGRKHQAHHDNAIALYGVRQYDRAIRESRPRHQRQARTTRRRST